MFCCSSIEPLNRVDEQNTNYSNQAVKTAEEESSSGELHHGETATTYQSAVGSIPKLFSYSDIVEDLMTTEVEPMTIDEVEENERSVSVESMTEEEEVPVESARQMAPTDDEIRQPEESTVARDDLLIDKIQEINGMRRSETPSPPPIGEEMIILEEVPDSDEKSLSKEHSIRSEAGEVEEKSRKHRKSHGRDAAAHSRDKEKNRADRSHSKSTEREVF